MNSKLFTVELNQSQLNLVITGLWLLERAEREHVRQVELKFGQLAKQRCAEETLSLADRLADLVKAKDRPPAAALNACLG